MKKLLLVLLLAFMPLFSFCQGLSFDQLISLYGSDDDAINDILVSKGWKFLHTKPVIEDTAVMDAGDITTWVYNYNEELENATAWLHSETFMGYKMNLKYLTDPRLVAPIKQKAISIGMKKTYSGVKDGAIYSIYEGKKYRFTFHTNKNGSAEINIETKN